MEIKEGEIFEYNGEWYQCIVENGCKNCAFNERECYTIVNECSADRRKDNKNVIFKKLEKVGEPYTHYCPSGRIIYFQRYKIFNKLYSHNTEYIMCDFNEDGIVSIELKQTKEDMEENKLNLKPFDIQKAREGKPVCTRDGKKARIICFDKQEGLPIVALVETKVNGRISEEIALFYINGRAVSADIDSKFDLMMLPEKKEGWMNIYSNGYNHKVGALIYNSKEEALNNKESNAIDTVKIEWRE